jgi:hypothetical protein
MLPSFTGWFLFQQTGRFVQPLSVFLPADTHAQYLAVRRLPRATNLEKQVGSRPPAKTRDHNRSYNFSCECIRDSQS